MLARNQAATTGVYMACLSIRVAHTLYHVSLHICKARDLSNDILGLEFYDWFTKTAIHSVYIIICVYMQPRVFLF